MGKRGSGQSFDTLLGAFLSDPSVDRVARQLGNAAQQSGRWVDLMQAANERLQTTTNTARQVLLCTRLAKWYGVDLQRPEYAAPYLDRAKSLDPKSVLTRCIAAQLYVARGDHEKAHRELSQALRTTTRRKDKTRLLFELGKLWSNEDPKQALGYVEQALGLDRGHRSLRKLAEHLYAKLGQPERVNASGSGGRRSRPGASRPLQPQPAAPRPSLPPELEQLLNSPEGVAYVVTTDFDWQSLFSELDQIVAKEIVEARTARFQGGQQRVVAVFGPYGTALRFESALARVAVEVERRTGKRPDALFPKTVLSNTSTLRRPRVNASAYDELVGKIRSGALQWVPATSS